MLNYIGGNKSKSSQQYVAECKQIYIKPLEDYKGWDKSLKYRCLKCSYEFECRPDRLKTKAKQGKTCYACWRLPILEKQRNERFKIKADNKHLIVLEYPKEANEKGKLHCSKCNFTFETTAFTMLKSKYCCPKFGRNGFVDKCKSKTYVLGKRVLKLHGYEPNALDVLLKNGYKSKDILTQQSGKVPAIPFKYKNKSRVHYPDFFIPSNNLIIEVKSNATFGINNKELYEKNRAKRAAAKAMGYKYKFIVLYQSGSSIILNPLFKSWYNLSFAKFNKEIRKHGHYICVGSNYFN